jgi:hypothetical protein
MNITLEEILIVIIGILSLLIFYKIINGGLIEGGCYQRNSIDCPCKNDGECEDGYCVKGLCH